MDRLAEIKEKFKDIGTLGGSDVVWLFMKIKDQQNEIERYQKALNPEPRISIKPGKSGTGLTK